LRVELVKLHVNYAKRENQSLLKSHPANIFPMYDNYPNLKHFIIVFKKAIKKLANLNISLPKLRYLILFIMVLSNI